MPMQTTIQQIGPAEYELEVRAEADELADELNQALRAQRARTTMRGFRPGKVPISYVKKLYGQALALEIAERRVQEAYEAEVAGNDEYAVLGQPRLTALEYELDEDLRAVIRFGVRPEIELKDLSGEEVTRLVHEVSDEDVEAEVERLRRDAAETVPTDEPAGEESFVAIDLQMLDDEADTPVVGSREEDVSFFLNDPRLKDDLRDALLGKKAGETFRVELPHEGGHGEHAHAHTHRYEVTVKDVKRLDLPELDAEFIREATNGEAEDEAGFRAAIRTHLEASWKQRTREYFEGKLVEKMLDLHPLEIPQSVTETFLDSFVEDVKRRNEGELPKNFNEGAFRRKNRAEAEQQAHWMLVRDRIVEDWELDVSDADLDAHFEKMAGDSDGEFDLEQIKRVYSSMPGLVDQLRQRVLSEKVYDALADRFTVVDKDRETLEAELEARRAAEAAAAAEAAEQAAAAETTEVETADAEDAAPVAEADVEASAEDAAAEAGEGDEKAG